MLVYALLVPTASGASAQTLLVQRYTAIPVLTMLGNGLLLDANNRLIDWDLKLGLKSVF